MEDDEDKEPLIKRRRRHINLEGPQGTHADFIKNLNPAEILEQLAPEALDKTLNHLNLTLPAGVPNAKVGMHITDPEHGMFFANARGQLVFQRTAELEKVPTMHLFTLYRFCEAYSEKGNGYEQFLIDEGWNRQVNVKIAPSFEVKQETIELIGN
jgi:hypothetical protein